MYQAPRGTSDILPQEQPYWRYIEQKAVNLCQLYGYERIDTPAFEDAGLFVRTVGKETDIVEKEMYTFEDRGGNKLTLRPEGTAPVCRAYIEHGLHNLPQPVKLYYITPILDTRDPRQEDTDSTTSLAVKLSVMPTLPLMLKSLMSPGDSLHHWGFTNCLSSSTASAVSSADRNTWRL